MPDFESSSATCHYARNRAWWWIPSLYFTSALPNAIVATVPVLMYQSFGVSNAEITFYTGLLYLPWVIKPLWSPLIDNLWTKRKWTLFTQVLLGLGMAGVAVSLKSTYYFPLSLLLFWLSAFWSATHDIAADGYYLLAIPEGDQAWFVGIRSTFYRLANLSVTGPLLVLIGTLQASLGNKNAWLSGFFLLGALLFVISIFHALVLPYPMRDTDRRGLGVSRTWSAFIETFRSFFRKPGIAAALAFLLFYRFAEAQLATVIKLFLVDSRSVGGLGLTTEQFGWYYGTIGIGCLLCGGILGGIVISKHGLGAWLWWMAAAINLPNIVYVYLSQAQPDQGLLIGLCIALETFGYGFGFTAYMIYMLHLARGEFETAHYAICTGFMALGMMIPAMLSGKLQELLGYESFFIWVMIATVPSFLACSLIRVDPGFGRRTEIAPAESAS